MKRRLTKRAKIKINAKAMKFAKTFTLSENKELIALIAIAYQCGYTAGILK